MTRYINQLHENTAPVTGDYLLCYDVSAAAGDEDRWVNVGKFGVLANAQTWVGAQSFAPTNTSTMGIYVNMPASTATSAIVSAYNGTNRFQLITSAAEGSLNLAAFDNGASLGTYLSLGRNSNASTPAASLIMFSTKGGTSEYVWVDNSANLRIGTTLPTSANDTTGTVVGAQTSWHELKENIRETLAFGALLDEVLKVRLYDYRMIGDSELNHDGSKPMYTGIVITEEDRRNDAWFAHNLGKGQIPSLNERNLFGYLIGSIQALAARVAVLEGRQ